MAPKQPLDEYRRKRDFSATPEPAGDAGGAPADAPALRYVVQKHDASRLHYDFRLELDGTLLSWAVPKGPSLDTHDKRLAVHVEDHPVEYGVFEGAIPKGEYGGGTVMVWDTGTWEPLGDARAGLAKGDFKFVLHGKKLQGLWVLVRLRPRPGEKGDNWLLIKEKDEFVRPHDAFDVLAEQPDSALTGRSLAQIAEQSAAADPPAAAAPDPAPPPAAAAPAAAPPPAAPEAPFPRDVDIELATLVGAPPEGDGWLAEVKYDGYRAVISLDAGSARVFTRSHADWTERFAPVARAAETLPATSAIIDGEVVVFDEGGVSRFGLLQQALGANPELLAFAAFDLLYLNGRDLRGLPLTARKALLATLLAEQPAAFPLRYADHVIGQTAELYRQACLSGLEGVVCKRADSHYTPGRGRDWQKVKCRNTQELVVGGFTEGAGSRGSLGALLVGTYDAGRLVYAGRVGTGFDQAGLSAMLDRLQPLETDSSPFDPAPRISGHTVHWTQPSVVIEAAFREWTAEGHLRQPVFLGVREDKRAEDVVRESAASGAGAADALPPDDPAPSPDGPAPAARSRKAEFGAPVDVGGVTITNPRKTLFPDTAMSKLEFAQYYSAIAPLMLAEAGDRPLTLVRCPVGHGRGCFYQRHPDAGLPEQVRVLPHSLKGEQVELLWVDSAEGLIALAQMGAIEVHTWLSRVDAPTRPDRMVFDLDPGPDVAWPQMRATALLVAEECSALGFSAYLKSTGSKGLHVVLPLEPVWEFERVRALAKALAEQIASRHPESLTSKMAKSQRGGRVFFDYLRNAEGASAVAPYSTRNLSGPPCAVPLAWAELTDDLDIRAFTPARVLERVKAAANPWARIDEDAAGTRVLRAAENKLGAG